MKHTKRKSLALLPANSLAALLGVDPRWLIAEAAAQRLPGVAAGRTYLFDPDAVEHRLIERAREEPSRSSEVEEARDE